MFLGLLAGCTTGPIIPSVNMQLTVWVLIQLSRSHIEFHMWARFGSQSPICSLPSWTFILSVPKILDEQLAELRTQIRKNLYYPTLHRPTFDRSVADGLHTRDASFGAVVLLVCAIGSRYSDDPRISPPGAEPLRCGWEFFDQLPFQLDHLFERPSLYHLQYYCVSIFRRL